MHKSRMVDNRVRLFADEANISGFDFEVIHLASRMDAQTISATSASFSPAATTDSLVSE